MVKPTQRRRRARGLTLIEVMIALLVTTIALLGALATVGITVRGANFSRSATEASVLAQSKLEQLVSTPVGTIGAPLPSGSMEALIDANGNSNPPGIYTRTVTWTTSLDTLRRTCTVEVDWPDAVGPGRPHHGDDAGGVSLKPPQHHRLRGRGVLLGQLRDQGGGGLLVGGRGPVGVAALRQRASTGPRPRGFRERFVCV